jgi:hypothetical protein
MAAKSVGKLCILQGHRFLKGVFFSYEIYTRPTIHIMLGLAQQRKLH